MSSPGNASPNRMILGWPHPQPGGWGNSNPLGAPLVGQGLGGLRETAGCSRHWRQDPGKASCRTAFERAAGGEPGFRLNAKSCFRRGIEAAFVILPLAKRGLNATTIGDAPGLGWVIWAIGCPCWAPPQAARAWPLAWGQGGVQAEAGPDQPLAPALGWHGCVELLPCSPRQGGSTDFL